MQVVTDIRRAAVALAVTLIPLLLTQAAPGAGLPPRAGQLGNRPTQVEPLPPGPSTLPAQPVNTEADTGYGPLPIKITGLLKNLVIAFVGGSDQQDVNRIFPEWIPVGKPTPKLVTVRDHRGPTVVTSTRVMIEPNIQALDGMIRIGDACHVSHEDLSISHYTHDFCFKVTPTPETSYLLSKIVIDDQRKPVAAHTQEDIECEWECGLGQDNDGNAASGPDKQGNSFGMYSAGHTHGAELWHWPTVPDRVHVEGYWVWDRGHTPETEIHPPRLVAVQRHLLAPVAAAPFEPSTPYYLGTRTDVYANGDGSAYWNNRPGQPYFVQPVTMNDRDYTFTIYHQVPRPGGTGGVLSQRAAGAVSRRGDVGGLTPVGGAAMKFVVIKQPGDTFPVDPIVQVLPTGTPANSAPQAKVTIPWRSRSVPNTAVFARSIYVYWDDLPTHGVGANYHVRSFQVTLDKFHVVNPQDGSIAGHKLHGEWRVFTEVGGHWYFLNDLLQAKPFDGGLSDVGADTDFTINKTFTLYVPPGGGFRVHADGWEADGIDNCMGDLADPWDRTPSKIQSWMNDHVLTTSVFTHGSKDDPIGEVNAIHQANNNYNLGAHTESSQGPKQTDDPSGDTDPNDDYRLTYHVTEVPLPTNIH